MLDIAWPELVVIGAVALVAIGPKDMPRVMHALGRWAGRARALGRELGRTFEQLEYEAQIADKLQKEKRGTNEAPESTARNSSRSAQEAETGRQEQR